MVLTHFTQGGHEKHTPQEIHARIKELLKQHGKTGEEETSEEPKISVNEAVGKVAFFYERLRTFIDYKDEHLLRKSAIERMLRRLLILHEQPEQISENLIHELIAARYLENNSVPESAVAKTTEIIKKYLSVRNRLKEVYGSEQGGELWNWFFTILPVELEDYLASSREEKAFVHALMETIEEYAIFEGTRLSAAQKRAHILLASFRAFAKSDHAMLEYHLLADTYPEWLTKANEEQIECMVHKMPRIHEGIHRLFIHPAQRPLARLTQKIAVLYHLLWHILHNEENVEEILGYKERSENSIRATYRKLYEQARTKLRRGAARSIVYIFITKMLVAFVLEYPYDVWIRHEVNTKALIINLLFPPFLMFIIALFIRFPAEKNMRRVVEGLGSLITEGAPKGFERRVRVPGQHGWILTTFYYIFYLALYVVTFGLVIYFLRAMHFNIVSSLLFLFFLTLVSFFGYRVRSGIRELMVEESHSFFRGLFTVFALPIIRAGRWLSINVSKINIFLFIFDVIIEAPLKVVLNLLEGFAAFFREKKEEIDQG